jgi:hypothetical protein
VGTFVGHNGSTL